MSSCSVSEIQDGCQQDIVEGEEGGAQPERDKQLQRQSAPLGGDGVAKKKRRRGKSKRKLNKPYCKMPWHQRRNPIGKKINRNRKIILAQSNLHAPYNTNQFLMEVHMPEAEGVFQMPKAPSARTRDSSFSVDSEENYFYSLPDDEEDYLTKEFSSVYEDAQSERLANMSKEELVEENMLLEAKVEALSKRIINRSTKTEVGTDVTMSTTNGESDLTSIIEDLNAKLKEQEEKIRDLQTSNETLRLQNERLSRRPCSSSSSEDSESDSSSSSSSSSSQGDDNQGRCVATTIENTNNNSPLVNGHSMSLESAEFVDGQMDSDDSIGSAVLVNGNGEIEGEMEHPAVN